MQPVSPNGFCTNCGKPLEPEAKFCIYCRTPVSSPISTPSAPVPMSNSGISCPNCGYINEPGTNFCIMCRTPLTNEGNGFSSKTGTILVDVHSDRHDQQPQSSEPDDDELGVRSLLVTITPDEARNGCTKQVDTKGYGIISVQIPAGTNPNTKIDVPGMGFDDGNGGIGPLRLSFYIIR